MKLPENLSADLVIIFWGLKTVVCQDTFGHIWDIRKPAANMFYVDKGKDKQGEPVCVYACNDVEQALTFIIDNACFDGYNHKNTDFEKAVLETPDKVTAKGNIYRATVPQQ